MIMPNKLMTILFGTFTPPETQGFKVSFDERSTKVATAPVPKRKGISLDAVIDALKRQPDEWMTIGMISAEAGCCDDTAQKILNKLASDQRILKRFADTGKRGGKNAVFKWKNKHGKKQKAA